MDQLALDPLPLFLDRPAFAHVTGQRSPQDRAEDPAMDARGAACHRPGGAACNRADYTHLPLGGQSVGGMRGVRGVELAAAGQGWVSVRVWSLRLQVAVYILDAHNSLVALPYYR